jgi:hypothetical protein
MPGNLQSPSAPGIHKEVLIKHEPGQLSYILYRIVCCNGCCEYIMPVRPSLGTDLKKYSIILNSMRTRQEGCYDQQIIFDVSASEITMIYYK